MRCLSQWMWRKGLREHPPVCPQHTAGVPSYPTHLTSSLQACLVLPRTALQEAPGRDLSLGHLPPHPWDWGQPKQLIPVGHIPSSLAPVQPRG